MGRITDGLGDEYEMVVNDDDRAPVLNLFFDSKEFEKTKIGYANLFNFGKTLRLQDIRIFDEAILIRRSRYLFFFVRCTLETRKFQRLGLGTKFLKSVFEFAKAKGFERVTGEIFCRDIEKKP